MTRTRRSSFRLLVVMVLLAGAPIAWAQQALAAPVAPVPTQVVTAKKVFISNAGVDATSPIHFQTSERAE